MEHSLAPKASQINSLLQELHMHFDLDQVCEEQREQRLSSPLAVELLSRTLKFRFRNYLLSDVSEMQVWQFSLAFSFMMLTSPHQNNCSQNYCIFIPYL